MILFPKWKSLKPEGQHSGMFSPWKTEADYCDLGLHHYVHHATVGLHWWADTSWWPRAMLLSLTWLFYLPQNLGGMVRCLCCVSRCLM